MTIVIGANAVALTLPRRNDFWVGTRESAEGKAVSRVFGENLARLRKKAGLSQEELAYRSSIHYSTIYLLENGKRQPRLVTIVKVAGALGAQPFELLEGLRWQPPAEKSGKLLAGGPKRSD